MRTFLDEVVEPEALKREEDGKRTSQEVVDQLCQMIPVMRLGPGKHLKGRTLLVESLPRRSMIISTELVTYHSAASTTVSLPVCLSPVLNFGSEELKAKIVPDVLSGKKFIFLGISEAFAGSDVGGLQTEAVKDGNHWMINGTKKWITNGVFGDSFTTILIPRTEGVEMKAIKTLYSPVAGTVLLTFDKVRVPVANTLGKEGEGMSVIPSNFNHERRMITVMSAATQRRIVEGWRKSMTH